MKRLIHTIVLACAVLLLLPASLSSCIDIDDEVLSSYLTGNIITELPSPSDTQIETEPSAEVTSVPETTCTPETTNMPETTCAPETTRIPETASAPETTKTPETTKVPETTQVEEIKYPKTYNEKGELVVYWLTGGSVWHESAKCRNVTNADPTKLHIGSAYQAYAAGKTRACKTCSADSVIIIPETTAESDITTAPEETASPSTDEGIAIVSWPVTASRNESVSVIIRGKANTKYYIEVNYKSGPSTSKDLEPKISDSNGEVIWTWKVGARSSAGTFDIIVKDDEGNSVKVEWTVVGN